VLEQLGIEPESRPTEPVSLGPAAQAVLDELRRDPASADTLARTASLDPGAVAGALVELELAGLVSEEAGTYREVMAPH
jgi:predicted Rossmann fold nucleotide-binding protein DprA/Smf involved in DNA uptake